MRRVGLRKALLCDFLFRLRKGITGNNAEHTGFGIAGGNTEYSVIIVKADHNIEVIIVIFISADTGFPSGRNAMDRVFISRREQGNIKYPDLAVDGVAARLFKRAA